MSSKPLPRAVRALGDFLKPGERDHSANRVVGSSVGHQMKEGTVPLGSENKEHEPIYIIGGDYENKLAPKSLK